MCRFAKLVVLMCIGATFMTAFLPAVTADTGGITARGTKMMSVEITGPSYGQSNATLMLKAHVFNVSQGDLKGANVSFKSAGIGTFTPNLVITDTLGANTTAFHAPMNLATQVLKVTITITANLTGYTNATTIFKIDVYPATRGAAMSVNTSVTHLAYVTTYDQGSPYIGGSSMHTGMDLLGNVQAIVNGKSEQVANISNWEKADQISVVAGMTHHVTTDMTGYYYYSATDHGIVFAYTNTTTRTHVYDASHSTWTNISVFDTITYMPAMMGFDMRLDQVGTVQEFVNTFMETTTTKNLDNGTKTTVSGPQTMNKRFMFSQSSVVSTFMGDLSTYVFVDDSGVLHASYSPALGIVVQEQEYNASGHLASTKVLTEYNDKKGEDPTSPALTVSVSADDPAPIAGTTTTVHVVATSGTSGVQGVAITTTVGAHGSLKPVGGTTDKDGKLDMVFSADTGISTTDVPVTVMAKKSGYISGSSDTVITVVQDTAVPVIHHIPTTHIGEGQAWTVSTNIEENAGVAEATLYYRNDVSLKYTPVPMSMYMGSWVATIPAGVLKPPRIEYYLESMDINGNEAFDPAVAPDDAYFDIIVEPTVKVLPAVSVPLSGGGSASVTAAVTGNLSLLVTKVGNPDQGPTDARFLGLFAEIKAVGIGQLVWANISFTYTTAQLGSLSKNELRVYWWDPVGLTWTTLDKTGVMTGTNMTWANVTHLTIFAPRAQSMPVAPPPVDSVPPTVSLDVPVDYAQVDQGTITIRGVASDNVALYSVQVQLDGKAWVDVSIPAGTKATAWSTTMNLPSGDHVISARAKDTSGNIGPVAIVHVKVLKEKPAAGITQAALLPVMAALIIVILVIVALYLINSKPEKKETGKDIEEDEDEQKPKAGEEE